MTRCTGVWTVTGASGGLIKREHRLKKDLKPVRGYALLLQCVASFISTLCVFLMLRYHPDKDLALTSIGVLHAIALLPALVLTGQYLVPVVLTLIVCFLYPVWGYLSGFTFCGLGAPFMHSAIWGCVLCIALRRPIAFGYMLMVGVISSISIFFVFEYDINVTGQPNDYGLSGLILIWHVIMMFALPLIVHHQPKPWPYVWRDPRICRTCGYSLAGIDPTAVCPECGSPRTTHPSNQRA